MYAKRIGIFLLAIACSAFIVTGANAYVVSYTLYLAQGTYEYTDSNI